MKWHSSLTKDSKRASATKIASEINPSRIAFTKPMFYRAPSWENVNKFCFKISVGCVCMHVCVFCSSILFWKCFLTEFSFWRVTVYITHIKDSEKHCCKWICLILFNPVHPRLVWPGNTFLYEKHFLPLADTVWGIAAQKQTSKLEEIVTWITLVK